MTTQVHVFGDPENSMRDHECWCDAEQVDDARVIYHREPCILSALSSLYYCYCCGQLSGREIEA